MMEMTKEQMLAEAREIAAKANELKTIVEKMCDEIDELEVKHEILLERIKGK